MSFCGHGHLTHRKFVIPDLGPMTAAISLANLASPSVLLPFQEHPSTRAGPVLSPSATCLNAECVSGEPDAHFLYKFLKKYYKYCLQLP